MTHPVRGTKFSEVLSRQGLRSVDVETQTQTQTTSMSKSERFSWTEPVLCHYNYDLQKSWFVYFTYTDQLTRKTKRCQYRGYINKIKRKDERIKNGNALVIFWKQRLRNGYNPFCEDEDVQKMPYHYTVCEAFDQVLALHLPSLGKRSKETYTYVVKSFTDWIKKNNLQFISIKDFPSTEASRYFDYLIIEKNYSGRTHNDHLIILKTLINRMIDREWIEKSPFKKISKKEAATGRNIAYSEQEAESLKKLLYEKDRQLYYFTQIMKFCFIRRSELARLRACDFDLINFTITIPSNVSKNKVQESVVIPVGLEPVLKEMELSKYAFSHYVFGRGLKTGETPYKNVNHISSRHNAYLKTLKISPEKGLYSWKHTGVIQAYYATGKDIYAIMRQLRHRSLETTQIYLKSLGLINNDVFRQAMVA